MVDFAGDRGFKKVILAGHSAGSTAAPTTGREAGRAGRRAGLVSWRVQLATAARPGLPLAQAPLVADGRGGRPAALPTGPTVLRRAATFLDLAKMGRC